jgi:serpin B
MWRFAVLALALLAMGSISVLGSTYLFAADPPPKPDDPADKNNVVFPETLFDLAKGNAEVASDLYKELSKEEGNIFFSPVSISEVLAMAYAGAAGTTAEAFEKTLHYTEKGDDLLGLYGHLFLRLAVANEPDKLELKLNNSLWVQTDADVKEDFAEKLDIYFNSGIYPVDFKNDEPTARGLINDWAMNFTDGKIKDLFPAPLDPLTKLVLANAVYFKGDWANAFDPKLSEEGKFYLGDGSTVDATFMKREARYNYLDTEKGVSVLELPYASGKVSLLIILPENKPESLKALESSLSAELLAGYANDLKSNKVSVTIPKFKISWGSVSLKDILTKLGLGEAFEPKADFSGIWPQGDLYISDLVHKAYVEVDEEGTTAAAATGASISTTAIALQPTPSFVADHPFIFLIRENITGSVIFLGRVSNPVAEK